jgi:hypothetical protein
MSVGVAVFGDPGQARRVGIVFAACLECADGCYPECPN